MSKYVWVLMLVCSSAYADRINVNLASHHFIDPPADIEQWNEDNLGLGYERHFEDHYFTVGYFDNSFDQTSVYAGIGKEWSHSKYVHTGVEAGLASGYEDRKEWVRTIFVGDKAVIADIYLSIGDKNRVKIIWTGFYSGIQYQLAF